MVDILNLVFFSLFSFLLAFLIFYDSCTGILLKINILIHALYKKKLPITIYFASESGTAEQLAHQLSEFMLSASGDEPVLLNIANFKKSLFFTGDQIAIFLLATYGNGEPPDSAKQFFTWLKNLDEPFPNLKYSVFGLGDSGYLQYNAFAKQVDTLLTRLGASRHCALALGDASNSMESEFNTWKVTVCNKLGLNVSTKTAYVKPAINIIHISKEQVSAKGGVFTGEPARLRSYQFNAPPFSAVNPFLAPLISNVELHRGGARSCRLIELDISNYGSKHITGGHIAISPQNSSKIVDRLCNLLNIDPGEHICFSSATKSPRKKFGCRFPTPCTYKTAFTHYLDICSPPRLNFLESLLTVSSLSEPEREFLLQLTANTESGNKKYKKWCLLPRRGIVELLENLSSCRPSADLLCQKLPRLQPRYYSIASSAKAHPNQVQVAVAVVDYTSTTGRRHKGVSTGWLSSLEVNQTKIPVFLRNSEFRLPSKSTTPIIMIAAGTGLAPFRAFIQEREFIKKKGGRLGEALLFYGCRRRTEDFLFSEELEEALNIGSLTHLYTAFSRENLDGKKIYVQHRLQEHSSTLWPFISPNGQGVIYICGDARHMAHDVRDVLIEICRNEGNMGAIEAPNYFDSLGPLNRCIFDVWS